MRKKSESTHPSLCLYKSIEINPRPKLLNLGHKRGAQSPRVHGVVRWVLRHVDRVEMSGMRHRKHKIEHRVILLGLITVLFEHARAVCKGVTDRRIKICDYALEQCA